MRHFEMYLHICHPCSGLGMSVGRHFCSPAARNARVFVSRSCTSSFKRHEWKYSCAVWHHHLARPKRSNCKAKLVEECEFHMCPIPCLLGGGGASTLDCGVHGNHTESRGELGIISHRKVG